MPGPRVAFVVVLLIAASVPFALADDKEGARVEAELSARLDEIKKDAVSRLDALAEAADEARKPEHARRAREAADQVRAWTFEEEKGVDFEALCAKWREVLEDSSMAEEERTKKLEAMGEAVKGRRTRVGLTIDELKPAAGSVVVTGRVGGFTLGVEFHDEEDMARLRATKPGEKVRVDGEVHVGEKKSLPGIDRARLARRP